MNSFEHVNSISRTAAREHAIELLGPEKQVEMLGGSWILDIL